MTCYYLKISWLTQFLDINKLYYKCFLYVFLFKNLILKIKLFILYPKNNMIKRVVCFSYRQKWPMWRQKNFSHKKCFSFLSFFVFLCVCHEMFTKKTLQIFSYLEDEIIGFFFYPASSFLFETVGSSDSDLNSNYFPFYSSEDEHTRA